MSHVTNIILITGCYDKSYLEVYEYLKQKYNLREPLTRVDQHITNPKAMECDVWMGTVNDVFDKDELVQVFKNAKWECKRTDQELDFAQLLIKEPADRAFSVYTIGPKDTSVESVIPEGYEEIDSLYYACGGAAEKDAKDFLASIGMRLNYENAYSPDKEYYIQYVSSGHERDSSGDNIVVWRKKHD